MNKSDSERIAAHLEKHGFLYSEDKNTADVVVLTTCGVRQSAEDRIYGLVLRLKKTNPRAKIVLAGCLSEREDVKNVLGKLVAVWLPIRMLASLNRMLAGKSGHRTDKNCGYLKILPKYESAYRAYVPIGNGCNNFCSYCIVPSARGREEYRPAQEIINEVKLLVKKGYKEIILIAQNVNSYKPDVKSRNLKENAADFADLLKMVSQIPGDFWVRFATSHPKDLNGKLIKTIAGSGKICRHIHLPAQSGDNGILQAMNRKYTAEQYFGLIGKIRKAMPDAAITTDIIVGFPGESRKQFLNTLKLFRKAKYDMAYISQYSPRPLTAAYKLPDSVPKMEKKRREKELTEILRKSSYANNKRYLNQITTILAEGRDKQGRIYGKTATDKKVLATVKTTTACRGHFASVKITGCRDFGLEGELIAVKS